MYWESESKPTYSASESRCWLTAHSLYSTHAMRIGMLSGKELYRPKRALFRRVRVASAHIFGLHVFKLRMRRIALL